MRRMQILFIIAGGLLLYFMHQSATAAQQSGIPLNWAPSGQNPMASGTQTSFFPSAPELPAMGPPPGEVITAPGSTASYNTGTWSNPEIVDNPEYLETHPISQFNAPTVQSAYADTPVLTTGTPMDQLHNLLYRYYGQGPLSAANWATLIVVLTGGVVQGPNSAVLFPDNPLQYVTLDQYFARLRPYMREHFGLEGPRPRSVRRWLT